MQFSATWYLIIFVIVSSYILITLYLDSQCKDCTPNIFTLILYVAAIIFTTFPYFYTKYRYYSKRPDPNKQAYDNIPESFRPTVFQISYRKNILPAIITIPTLPAISYFIFNFNLQESILIGIPFSILFYLLLILQDTKIYKHIIIRDIVKPYKNKKH